MRQFAQIAHRGAHGNQLDTLRGLSLSTTVAGVASVGSGVAGVGGVVAGVVGSVVGGGVAGVGGGVVGVVGGVVGGGVGGVVGGVGGGGVVEMFYLGHQALQVCASRGFT